MFRWSSDWRMPMMGLPAPCSVRAPAPWITHKRTAAEAIFTFFISGLFACEGLTIDHTILSFLQPGFGHGLQASAFWRVMASGLNQWNRSCTTSVEAVVHDSVKEDSDAPSCTSSGVAGSHPRGMGHSAGAHTDILWNPHDRCGHERAGSADQGLQSRYQRRPWRRPMVRQP